MKPVSGLTLGNRYRLVRQIAVGGMGEVWVAKDTALSREVAVKVLREEYAGNEDFLERLRTEARNSAALSHRNIAAMFDYGEQRGSGYLVMELVHGEPMSDLLEREPVIPLSRLLPILSQTAHALHAAHTGGVVHRDVKPGNILLDHSGEVKITDFGVSLAANQVPMTATGMVMGTAQYLSPEQAIGQAATGASDIYALGIVAYEAVAGHRPFTGATPVDIAVAHVNEPVPPLPRTVDPELSDLIMAMLAKDPRDRPHPADALARALEEMTRRVTNDPWGASAIRRTAQYGRHGTSSGAAAHRRSEDLAPVITPIVIPAAVRRGASVEVPDDETHSRGHLSPTRAATPPDGATPTTTPRRRRAETTPEEDAALWPSRQAPALPWERPQPTKSPASRSGDDGARAGGSNDAARRDSGSEGLPGAPRSYPPRRDLRKQPSTPTGRSAPETPPGTRRASSAGSRSTRRQPPAARRGAPAPRRRAVPRFTWPLVALVVLLAVILIVTIVAHGNDAQSQGLSVPSCGEGFACVTFAAGFSAHRFAAPPKTPGIVMTSLSHTAALQAVGGMIAPETPPATAPAAPTTPKDI